jgi:long-chain acyl-CoA synthetase
MRAIAPTTSPLSAAKNAFTYKAFNAYVNKLANALLACGTGQGGQVRHVLPNCTQLMAAYWAAAKTGLVIVPSSTMLNEGGLATLLKNSDTALVVADAAFADALDHIREEPAGHRRPSLRAGGPRRPT